MFDPSTVLRRTLSGSMVAHSLILGWAFTRPFPEAPSEPLVVLAEAKEETHAWIVFERPEAKGGGGKSGAATAAGGNVDATGQVAMKVDPPAVPQTPVAAAATPSPRLRRRPRPAKPVARPVPPAAVASAGSEVPPEPPPEVPPEVEPPPTAPASIAQPPDALGAGDGIGPTAAKDTRATTGAIEGSGAWASGGAGARRGAGSRAGSGRGKGSGTGDGSGAGDGSGTGDGSGAGAGSGAGDGNGAGGMGAWLGVVRARISAAKRYPLMARRMRTEGTVRLTLRIDAAGQLLDAKARAGAPEVLEEAALAAVHEAAPFPQPPEGQGVVSIEVPLVFSLNFD